MTDTAPSAKPPAAAIYALIIERFRGITFPLVGAVVADAPPSAGRSPQAVTELPGSALPSAGLGRREARPRLNSA
jgi:hypothetical protein